MKFKLNDSLYSKRATRDSLKQFIQIRKRFIRKISPFFDFAYKYYFRCTVKGWENVPEGKVLFVGNHNGMITFEVLMFFHAWWKKFGKTKTALGLAHGFVLNHALFKWLLPKIGAIPADPELAKEAFDAGYSLLVYPGGKKECFRPFYERKKVNFFQRKGFIKLALAAKVPIVPVVSIGAHESYVILSRGEKLAQLFGIKQRWKVPGIPITFRMLIFLGLCVAWALKSFSFFWLLLSFFSIFIPLPVQMTFCVLPPIDPAAIDPIRRPVEESLQRTYDQVYQAMQRTMTEAYAKRKHFFG